MNLQEIIEKDIKRNEINITIEDVRRSLALYQKESARFYRFNGTIFVVYKTTDSAIFYHTINAEPLFRFVKNLRDFFNLVENKEFAITYFSNDKIKSIYKKYGDEVVDAGQESVDKYKGITKLKRWRNG